MNELEKAEKVARKAHEGQRRKNGESYSTHLELVVSQFDGDEFAQTVAWLHDVIEDTDVTAEELREHGFSEDVLKEVILLSKPRELSYQQYINRIKSSLIAVKVKKADIVANLIDNPGNKQTIKLAKALIQLCT